MLSIFSILIAGRSLAACTEPSTSGDIADSLERAEAAWEMLDEDTFRDATDALIGELDCASDLLSRSLAARTHRALGLRAFVDRDAEGAARAFAAARAVEPFYTFPDALIPPGHPIRMQYAAIPIESGRWIDVPPPESGALSFDGQTGLRRPADWPTILQIVDPQGAVLESDYLSPADPLPLYDQRTSQADPGRGRALPVGLLCGAGASALAGGILYGLAAAEESRFSDTSVSGGAADEELNEMATRINRRVVGSAVAGGLALGFGVGAAVSW